MTKKTKITILNELGEDIKFHFLQFEKQRRLIVDAIFNHETNAYDLFNNTTKEQNIASKILDDLLNKYTGGGNNG